MRINETMSKEIVSLYQSGASHKAIAARFGLSDNGIKYHLQRKGIANRNPRPRKLFGSDVPNLVKAYVNGESTFSISKRLKMHHSTIVHHLKLNGVKLRPRRLPGTSNPGFRGGWFSSPTATQKVHKAVKGGAIKRPELCEACHKPSVYKDGRPGIHGHHDDYNKPLEVRWLCRKCHYAWHRVNNAIPKKPRTKNVRLPCGLETKEQK